MSVHTNRRQSSDNPSIILFDGVCNLCNGWVQFVIRRDPNGAFRFASLQSGAAKSLLPPGRSRTDSIILLEQEHLYTESSAVLRICRKLKGPWKAAYLFILVPKPLRDWIYRWIARHRYDWFGKRDHCMIPTEEDQKRFLPDG
ncbi:thiol-disulfide oxidoreductase DCC family protein [Paludifilum halophilum]|uniref:Thiol-disulfide oxidoreductase n=1 Tax=Paludifilum halophilum TaxID=1642702 RepID=A0A235B5M7_9BACL|nr:thiol-disulfide oxidoreductase DCC family protein [Paludifilum halophilum]OYD07608.1 thiol-disulfide oxidoreductase [Paludifilum halophilum]